ncbi:hypothetical protein M2322_004050 [Rhodoblastus acidophilus]|nr:hypothetical protein [Rhodoblastus acidophilus]
MLVAAFSGFGKVFARGRARWDGIFCAPDLAKGAKPPTKKRNAAFFPLHLRRFVPSIRLPKSHVPVVARRLASNRTRGRRRAKNKPTAGSEPANSVLHGRSRLEATTDRAFSSLSASKAGVPKRLVFLAGRADRDPPFPITAQRRVFRKDSPGWLPPSVSCASPSRGRNRSEPSAPKLICGADDAPFEGMPRCMICSNFTGRDEVRARDVSRHSGLKPRSQVI